MFNLTKSVSRLNVFLAFRSEFIRKLLGLPADRSVWIQQLRAIYQIFHAKSHLFWKAQVTGNKNIPEKGGMHLILSWVEQDSQ